MPTFAELLEIAAFEYLAAPSEDTNKRRVTGPFPHTYSCNAICEGKGDQEKKNYCQRWYFRTVLCADRPHFPASTIADETDDPQNVRFMLLLFASYLAADEGL